MTDIEDSGYLRDLRKNPEVLSADDEYWRGVVDAEYDVSTSNPVGRRWFNDQPEGYQTGYNSVTPHANMNWSK